MSPWRQCGVTDLCPEAGLTGNVISLESSVFIRCCHLDRRLWDAICFPEKSGFTLWEAQEIPKKELMNMKEATQSFGPGNGFLDRSKGLHDPVPKGALSSPPLNSHIGYKRQHGPLRRLVQGQQRVY